MDRKIDSNWQQLDSPCPVCGRIEMHYLGKPRETSARIIHRCRRCQKAGRPLSVVTADYVWENGHYWDIPNRSKPSPYMPGVKCPVCGDWMYSTHVKGELVPGHPCNHSCKYAVTGKCSCSCRGANHGAGWIELQNAREAGATDAELLGMLIGGGKK